MFKHLPSQQDLFQELHFLILLRIQIKGTIIN